MLFKRSSLLFNFFVWIVFTAQASGANAVSHDLLQESAQHLLQEVAKFNNKSRALRCQLRPIANKPLSELLSPDCL